MKHSFSPDLVRWASHIGTRLDDILDNLLSDDDTSDFSVYLLADWAVNVGYEMLRIKLYILTHGLSDDFFAVGRRIYPEQYNSCDFTESNFYDDVPPEHQMGVFI